MKKNIFIFGFGYTAKTFSSILLDNNYNVVGTSRDARLRAKLTAPNILLLDFNNGIRDYLNAAQYILICTPPNEYGEEPVLEKFQDIIIQNKKNIQWIGYLSSTGVYGDHQGQWVTELSECIKPTLRATSRLRAENKWLTFFRDEQLPVHVFRLAGIYGPERNSFKKILSGQSTSIFKEKQMFSRIHVHDIGNILLESIKRPTPGEIFNVSDDLPAPIHEVEAYAASLLNYPNPILIPFDEAHMSPMAKEFFKSNKKVSNHKLKTTLNLTLKFPSYREGLKDGCSLNTIKKDRKF